MANIFKFRNLFCLIHKLYIALVKKKKKQKKKKTETKTKKKQWKQDTISKSGPFQLSKYKSSESCIYRLEQDKIMNGAMTFHKTKFYVTEGSFLGLINCLYKKKRKEWNSSVPNQLVTHLYKPTVSWQTTCFHFLSHLRARILIHFSRDSTGNRKDCGIKIFFILLW